MVRARDCNGGLSKHAAAIKVGIVHEIEGLTRVCDPAWPDIAQQVMKEARNVYLPSHMTSQNYFDACDVRDR